MIDQVSDRTNFDPWITSFLTIILLYGFWLFSLLFGIESSFDSVGEVFGADFIQFYSAAFGLREDLPIYDRFAQHLLQEKIIGTSIQGSFNFNNPPLFVLIFYPLTFLSYKAAFVSWIVIQLLLLIFSIKIISQEPSTLKLFIILSWFPIFTTFSYGQNSIFFLFILASAIKCLRQGYLFQSGLLTGVLALKPQLLPAFLIAWACAGKKGITGILGIIISISSLVLVSYLFMPESSQAYLSIVKSELFQIEKVSGFSYAKQHTLMSFFHLLFGDLVAAKIFCFVLMLFAIYFTRSIFIKYKNNEHLIFSFGALLLPCVSPYLMIYDLCLLIIPALVIWDEFKFSKIFSKKIYSFIWIVIPLNVTLLIPLQSRFLPWSIHFAELGLLVTFALIVNKMLTEDCLSIQSKT